MKYLKVVKICITKKRMLHYLCVRGRQITGDGGVQAEIYFYYLFSKIEREAQKIPHFGSRNPFWRPKMRFGELQKKIDPPKKFQYFTSFWEASLFMGWGREITGDERNRSTRKGGATNFGQLPKGGRKILDFPRRGGEKFLDLINFFNVPKTWFFHVLGYFGHFSFFIFWS